MSSIYFKTQPRQQRMFTKKCFKRDISDDIGSQDNSFMTARDLIKARKT